MRVEVRGDNINVPKHTREVIEKKARLTFGRVAGAVAEIRIVIRDANGPRIGGLDRHCAIDVRLRRGGEIRAEAADDVQQDAVDDALDRASRSTLRLIARQQEYRRDSIRFPLPDARY